MRIRSVGPSTVVAENLSAADVSQIRKVVRQKMWRSNLSDLLQVVNRSKTGWRAGIRFLPIMLRRQLFERMQEIEVQPDGIADVLTRTRRNHFKTSGSTNQLPRYSIFSREFTVEKGTNGWHVVHFGFPQLN